MFQRAAAWGSDDRARREERVRHEFWDKAKRVAARLPFAEDLLAAYYCALDHGTPVLAFRHGSALSTALRFESQGLGWAYGDTPVFVLTHRDLPRNRSTVELYSGDLATLLNERLRPKFRSIWVGGGGAVAGAIIGGALGNQVGDGDGRRAATVAGAVIGGIVGNNAERRSSRRRNVYDILVNMDRGRSIWVTQSELRGVREGSRVVVRNGRVSLRY